jgi:hypothetical protein
MAKRPSTGTAWYDLPPGQGKAVTSGRLPAPEITGDANVNARKGNSPSGQGGSPTGPANIVGFMKPQTYGKGPLPIGYTTPTGATKGDTGVPFRGPGASPGPTRKPQGSVSPKGSAPNMDYTTP